MTPDEMRRIRKAVSAVSSEPEARQLDVLKRLCMEQSGRWDFTADLPHPKRPFLFEIQLYGVFAMASSRDDLAKNWLKAATNILKFEDAA